MSLADSYGQPKDSDSDGIPDYVEDANGNGVVDANETDPNNAMSDGIPMTFTVRLMTTLTFPAMDLLAASKERWA